MNNRIIIILILLTCAAEYMQGQAFLGPDTVSIHSGTLTLKALLWNPSGRGPFPAIIYCHGSWGSNENTDSSMVEACSLGPVYARKGYIFLSLFRRGVGLSRGQGRNSSDLMDSAFNEKGQVERNNVQLRLLETDQLQDMISGLQFLQKLQNVDTSRIGVVGASFGGAVALLLAEGETCLKAVVIFAVAGYSWDRSPELRARLIYATTKITAPIMIIHAQNDYSVNPAHTLDSVLNQLTKPHVVKIYPKFGNSKTEGHMLIFLGVKIWEADVFRFLNENLRH